MMSQYIDIFINYLNLHGDFLSAYFPIIVFFIILFESTPIVGTLVPGNVFLLFFGFSAFSLDMNISLTILAATLGAVFGDILVYFLGRYGSDFLLRHKRLLKEAHIHEGRKFFVKHGVKSIFIGRFVGPIRTMIPLIAGTVSMKLSTFIFYDLLSAFLWSILYVSLGFYFGNYIREIEGFASKIGILLTLVIVILFVLYYIRNKNKKKNENS
jgi:membrane protein DedA with SNARE-associated domain